MNYTSVGWSLLGVSTLWGVCLSCATSSPIEPSTAPDLAPVEEVVVFEPPPPFAPAEAFRVLFEAGQEWSLEGMTREICWEDESLDDVTTDEPTETTCRIVQVEGFEHATVSVLECDDRQVGGVFMANRVGLWINEEGIPSRAVEWLGPAPDALILEAEPLRSTMRQTFSDDAPGTEYGYERTVSPSPDGSWCVTIRRWGRYDTERRWCIHAERGLTEVSYGSNGGCRFETTYTQVGGS